MLSSCDGDSHENKLDCFVFLPFFLCPTLHVSQALSSESVERLPVFNKSALRHYQTSIEADDWSIPSSEPKKLGKYDYGVQDVRTEGRVK